MDLSLRVMHEDNRSISCRAGSIGLHKDNRCIGHRVEAKSYKRI